MTITCTRCGSEDLAVTCLQTSAHSARITFECDACDFDNTLMVMPVEEGSDVLMMAWGR